MIKSLNLKLAVVICLLAITACSSDDGEYDPYHDWQERNEVWYELIADSARTAINAAKAQYGTAWEDHCRWRMYKTLTEAPNRQSETLTDSVCVYILSNGTGDVSPAYTDSIRVHFRATLMPTIDAEGNTENTVFAQTYYGPFDPTKAAPAKYGLGGLIAGFSTAVQYMVKGDDWIVYIPSDLGYGATATTQVPAYSTLRYRINLAEIYETGDEVPDWQ
jgi:FKBP-type peptidyl-prolyl cis-trans isomerase FklB